MSKFIRLILDIYRDSISGLDLKVFFEKLTKQTSILKLQEFCEIIIQMGLPIFDSMELGSL